MDSLGNHFNSPVEYHITTRSQEFMYMVFNMMCWYCGRIVVEEIGKTGTMITCLTGDGGCGRRFWIDED